MLLVGDPSVFAIESSIARRTDHALGLGYFVIHAAGRQFGVKEEDATLLGNAYDEVMSRLERRGLHLFGDERGLSAEELAMSYVRGEFLEVASGTDRALAEALGRSGVVWRAGDEHFDDGSLFLLFDRGNAVRLVGVVNRGAFEDIRNSVVEVAMASDAFYGALELWSRSFMQELGRRTGDKK